MHWLRICGDKVRLPLPPGGAAASVGAASGGAPVGAPGVGEAPNTPAPAPPPPPPFSSVCVSFSQGE